MYSIQKNFADKALTFLVLIYISVLFCIALKASWPFIADDSYITLRYAKHLAEGYGITWNIAQPPLEGYSNFTYLLLASLLYSLQPHFHYEVIDIIRYFSLASFVATFFMMYRTMRLWVSPTIALLPIALLVSYPSAMLWATSGLEMPFFQLLITSTVYALCTKHFKIAGLCIAFASLTRPEGPLFFLVFLGILFFQTRQSFQKKSFFSHPLFLYIITFTAIFLPYFIFRLTYFGRLFPNPVYCKFMNKEEPLLLLKEYCKYAVPLLIASIPAWTMKPHHFIYYFVIPAIVCFFMLYGVDPIVGYANRYAIPFLGLLMMSAVLGLHALLQYYAKPFLKHHILTTAIVLIFALLCTPGFSFTEVNYRATAYHTRNAMRASLAEWVNNLSPQPSSIVVADCGIIPLDLDHMEVIDSLCLNSREMTTPPINKSYARFAHWVLYEKKPDYIVLTQIKFENSVLRQPFEKNLLKNSDFLNNYKFIKNYSVEPRDYSYQYFIYQRIEPNNLGETYDNAYKTPNELTNASSSSSPK